jgi:hypothetical protein
VPPTVETAAGHEAACLFAEVGDGG